MGTPKPPLTLLQGTLDVPWSIHIDRRDHLVSLQVFSFSKILEGVSAETVKRTVTGRTGTVSIGSKVVTVSSTTDLAPNDLIELDDGTTQEEQTIAEVVSATRVDTVVAWTNAFSADTLTLLTPFYRFKTIEFLLNELFDAATIPDRVYELVGEINASLIVSALNEAGLPPGVKTPFLYRSRIDVGASVCRRCHSSPLA